MQPQVRGAEGRTFRMHYGLPDVMLCYVELLGPVRTSFGPVVSTGVPDSAFGSCFHQNRIPMPITYEGAPSNSYSDEPIKTLETYETREITLKNIK